MRFGGYQPPTSVHTQAAQICGQVLEARLGSAVRFELDSNIVASGHSAADLLPMVEGGTLTMCYFSLSYLAERVPECALLDLPFVFTDRTKAYAVLDGAFGELLTDRFHTQTGFRVLGFWDNGFRHLSNAVRPIRTPADCAGLRLRTQFSAMHAKVFRRLGFEPVALDVKDLIAGVQSGRIEAQENPLTTIYNFGLHAFHRYLTLTGHFFGTVVVLCHRDSYAAWPLEVRQAVHEAVMAATVAQRQLAAAADDEVLAQLHPAQTNIVRLTAAERDLFVAAVAPLVEEQRQHFGEQLCGYLGC
jgi:tripartite ATP-independent transporter DctP family solute receptor